MVDGCINSISVYNKSGRYDVTAQTFIDCTGDADAAAAAGVPFSFGREDGRAQNVTLLFTMGDVELDRVVGTHGRAID